MSAASFELVGLVDDADFFAVPLAVAETPPLHLPTLRAKLKQLLVAAELALALALAGVADEVAAGDLVAVALAVEA